MSGIEPVFVDTNVWLYALLADVPTKQVIAAALLQRASIATSVQIVNEVCVNLKRKAQIGESDLRSLIESFFEKCLVVPLDKGLLLEASILRERYSLSFWDSTVAGCALRCGSAILYSEDMQNGLFIEGKLRIVNPFV